jgi:hypothetical protein
MARIPMGTRGSPHNVLVPLIAPTERLPHALRREPKRVGQMPVLMTTHGGVRGALDALEGLVIRNMRSVQAGLLDLNSVQAAERLPNAQDGIWRDAMLAHLEGCMTAGTIAAWRAAEERVNGRPARVGLVDGQPRVILGGNAEGIGAIALLDTGVAGYGADAYPFVCAGMGDTEGRTTVQLRLTLDDEKATSVRDVCSALARHNAKRIAAKGLPRLYKTDVEYRPEGSPELWWDAEEILDKGYEDCDGLASYRAGELIAKEDLDADVYCRLIQKPSTEMGGSGGGRLFHAITRVRVVDPKTGQARYEYDDPSARCGMPIPEWYAEWAEQRRAEGKGLNPLE